ncbi:vacuolar protein sorting-associated protein 41 homolog isoform X2 [Ornithodoros turicata]|uniref:vacuolar protein sorting-associated protein 41 homolog isoform X2 n=1 Tax=Ornithodoros turicata TaxID=34597 RepID=UPI003138AB0C
MDDDNYSNDEQDEDLSEDEEEPEPKLQYERLTGDLPGILRNDAASCIAVHPKLLALGMHSGVIYILDHQGNNSRNDQLKPHTKSLTQISIDNSGEYLASCSNDGKVIVQGLYSHENIQTLTLDCPVRAVALDPSFHRLSSRRFIICTDKVILYERTFLPRYKNTTIYQGEGTVHCVSWNGRFVAFATDMTTVVYDMYQRDITSKIKRSHDPKLSSDLYRCSLSWQDYETLLVGWADTVKVCKVKPYKGTAPPPPGCLSDYYVEIVSMFTTDFFIAGLAPLGTDTMAALTLRKDQEEHTGGNRPELRVLEPLVDDYTDQSSDILTVRGFASYHCADYHLECLPEEGLFFIVSPRDVIVAKPRDEDDHVAWLLEHNKYEEALAAAASSRALMRHTLRGIGEEYIVHLLSQKAYVRAAEVCALALSQDKALWEANVYRFAQHRQLRALAAYLPKDEPRLDPTAYEIALNEFLQLDPQGFLDLVSRWNSDLYSVQTVVNAVLDRLSYEPTCVPLLQALAKLYTYQAKFDLAMSIYLKIGASQEVFQLVESYGLFDAVQEKLLTLMELDTDKAIALLLDQDNFPISHVVERLREQSKLLYSYLDAVLTKNPATCDSYHMELATLYAEFDPPKLLPLLRSSNNYPLEEALHLCEKNDLIPEVIFLLGRMGNTKQALQHIMEKLSDVQQAITFCKENNDIDLWKDLIAYSLDKPHFITTLLHSIGTHVDPILLIKCIPKGLQIPQLRDALVKILRDYNLQISLREGCKKILVSDCITLLSRLNRQQSRAIFVDDNQMCPACDRKLLCKDDIVLFFCKHTFHRNCLPIHGNSVCTICSLEKSRWFGS